MHEAPIIDFSDKAQYKMEARNLSKAPTAAMGAVIRQKCRCETILGFV